jgi:hypothetical protein
MNGNGRHDDHEDRIARIEKLVEHVMNEHEAFRAELRMFLGSQVVFKETQEKTQRQVDQLAVQVSEIGDKLDGLIDLVERDHREFHARLTRLEQR